jgi:chaperonin GroES
MKLNLLSNYVAIETVEPEKQTEAGIVLPITLDEGSTLEGVVVAVGPGEYNSQSAMTAQGVVSILKPTTVKVGDKVIFLKRKFEKLKVDGKDLRFGSEDGIWAIITE